jgi:hypothetical protein
MTIRPINPSITVLSQGCSDSIMVTYPLFLPVSRISTRQSPEDNLHHRDIPTHTAHNIFLAVEVVLVLSVEFDVIGNVVVTLCVDC